MDQLRKGLKEFTIKVQDKEVLYLSTRNGIGKYILDPNSFRIDDLGKLDLSLASVLRYISWQDWNNLEVFKGDQHWFNVKRLNSDYEITKLKLDDLPLLALKISENKILEWSTQTNSQPLDNILELFNQSHFGIPGFRYDSTMYANAEFFKFKAIWKGNIQPILSRSSCRALIQERPELSFLLGIVMGCKEFNLQIRLNVWIALLFWNTH